MRLRIVSAIALHLARPASRVAPTAAHGGNFVHQGQQLREVVTVGPRQCRGQRKAPGIGDQMMLGPQFTPVHGAGTGVAATVRGAHRSAVDHGSAPVDVAGGLEFAQQSFQQPVPNAAALPLPEPPQAGVARGELARGGKVLPRHSGLEGKHNAVEHAPRGHRLSAGTLNMAVAEPGLGQQGLDPHPKIIRHQWLSHPKTYTPSEPAAGTSNKVDFASRSKSQRSAARGAPAQRASAPAAPQTRQSSGATRGTLPPRQRR